MRRILLSALTLAAAAAFLVIAGGAGSPSPAGTYKIEVDNAFGLVTGADFKVAGVRAGSIKSIDLDPRNLHAVVTVSVTQKGFDSFRSDVFCQTRPQSLIGEYFIECDPGHSGQVLPPGSTIPVDRTRTTIAPDLLTDIMRLPYRQRFAIIIGELGAAVAGRSGDLQKAIHRAVPALDQTDNLLKTLADDSTTLQQLTAGSDQVITALANNNVQVARFIQEADRAASLSASRNVALKATFHKLPAFLEQLKPTLTQLGAATDANTPVLNNLNASAGQINRLLHDLVPFSDASKPAISSLGQASVTGRTAVTAARPTIAHLNTFAKPAPELTKNLGIVLPALDDRSRAVEADPRSPGGKGYTGLEALLQYVFNQTLAINYFGPYGHVLAVDAFVDARCSSYADAASIAQNLKSFGARARECYAWLGPNQPGINETDPSNPKAAVPDPGGAPPGEKGPVTSAAKLTVPDHVSRSTRAALTRQAKRVARSHHSASAAPAPATAPAPAQSAPARTNPVAAAGTGAVATVKQTIGAVLSGLLGRHIGIGGASPGVGTGAAGGSSATTSSAQKLLNYLLAP